MYTYFLIFQSIQENKKCTGKSVLDIPWNKDAILSLGKLAFHHLEKNNLIFYSDDLADCGIDPTNISMYSGVCTQQTGRFSGTVFSFVHLSIQEFIAALFAYVSLRNDNRNVFDPQSTLEQSSETKMIDLLKTAVDKALESENGHLDLFLRFLLGLTVEKNQKLIRGLLTHSGCRSECQKDIVEYIKFKFGQNPAPERWINLFYCLNELNDDTLVKEIQSYVRSGRLSEAELSPALWSALVFVLLTSEENLDVFDLQKFIRSDECFKRLLPVVQEATTVLLNKCNLTEKSFSALLTVLRSESSKMTGLDLSNNDLQDSGVKLICDGLENPNCKLEKLGLSDCGITEEGYVALAGALRSNSSSHLIELDLRGNDPGESGVKLLTDLLQDPNCNLNKLRFLSYEAEQACDYVNKVLNIKPLLQTDLDLSEKIAGDSELKKLCALLQDPHCRTQKLRLKNSGITKEHWTVLSSSFHSNPSHIRELDLSENLAQNSGVKKLCDLLKNQECKLQILRLSDCGITEEGYVALAEALRSNSSSHLIELDLRGNDPGESGVKLLTDLLQDPNCNLNKLRILKDTEAEHACDYVNKVLDINPLLQTDLDLSEKIAGDSGLKELCALLQDPHCRTQKLRLNKCGLTSESCSSLATVLSSDSCFLSELDLSDNNLQNSGVQKLCAGLKNPQCHLRILRLSDCGITEEGYVALTEALRSNSSSHLTELDLRGNNPGESGVQVLIDLLQDPNCNLEKLRLLKSPAAQEACKWISSVLGTNPLLLKELELNNNQGDLGVKKLAVLLQDPHCKLSAIKINKCIVTMESCSALASALSLASCSVRNMNLSNNDLQESGLKQIIAALKHSKNNLKKLVVSKCGLMEESCSALVEVFQSEHSQLSELDLSENNLQDTGVKMLSDGLKHSRCNLEKLLISKCGLMEESCLALGEVFQSEHSHLRELDLSENNLQDSGVTLLSDGLKHPQCKLEKLMISKCGLMEESCLALAEVLSSKSSHLRELDLSNNNLQDSGVKFLSDGLKNSHSQLKIIRLCNCSITDDGCIHLVLTLEMIPSVLIELDLNENQMTNSGVKQISNLLRDPRCLLQTLKLSDCGITEEGYVALTEALRSNSSSHLIELDLRGNNPGESGVKLLTDLLQDPNCNLNKLRILKDAEAEQACDYVNKVLNINPLLQTELVLSEKIAGDSGLKQLCALLQDPHCRTQKLRLNNCSISYKGCTDLKSALCSNPSHLRELDLSKNEIEDYGVHYICNLLSNSHYKLEKLVLSDCGITEEGYVALTEALRSNSSSHLIELDLRGNDPGESGVKLLTDLLQNPNCNLNKLRLLKSPEAEQVFDYLNKVLNINPLLQPQLDLSEKIAGDSELKQLCALVQDPHCRTQKLRLSNCNLTEEGCSALSAVLRSESSTIRELSLSNNPVKDSGVKLLSEQLTNPICKLEIIGLSDCGITEEGYVALTEALRSNSSSHLIELDLRGNNPGESGVKLLTDLLQDPNCNLNKLRVLRWANAEEGLASMTKVLKMNPLLLHELDLSKFKPKELKVKQICGLLKDSHCKIKKLTLYKEDFVTEKNCADVIFALVLNPSHMRELKLNGNKLGESGLRNLCDFLKNPQCKLEKLELCQSISKKCSTDLTSALCTNPSHLQELDLSKNPLGDLGVKKLCYLLKNQECKLQTLRMKKCLITDEGCTALTSALKLNPSHLRELDLRENKVGASVTALSSSLTTCKVVCDNSKWRKCKHYLSGEPGNKGLEPGISPGKTKSTKRKTINKQSN